MHAIKILLVLLMASSAEANLGCDVYEYIAGTDLATNAKFWEDLGKLQAKGAVGEMDMADLIAEHSRRRVDEVLVDMLPQQAITKLAAKIQYPFNVSKSALKAMEKIPAHIKSALEEFYVQVRDSGPAVIQELHKAQGRWNLHKMKTSDEYSVRLNGGYRVTFEIVHGEVNVLDVGQHIYKH